MKTQKLIAKNLMGLVRVRRSSAPALAANGSVIPTRGITAIVGYLMTAFSGSQLDKMRRYLRLIFGKGRECKVAW